MCCTELHTCGNSGKIMEKGGAYRTLENTSNKHYYFRQDLPVFVGIMKIMESMKLKQVNAIVIAGETATRHVVVPGEINFTQVLIQLPSI